MLPICSDKVPRVREQFMLHTYQTYMEMKKVSPIYRYLVLLLQEHFQHA